MKKIELSRVKIDQVVCENGECFCRFCRKTVFGISFKMDALVLLNYKRDLFSSIRPRWFELANSFPGKKPSTKKNLSLDRATGSLCEYLT